MKKFQMNKKSGFSMLELVVVMLIMGTLAGIAISKMGGSDIGAIKASVKSDLRGAIARINACYADKLSYKECAPTTTAGVAGGTSFFLKDSARAATTYSISLSPNNAFTLDTASATNGEFPAISIANTNIGATKNKLVYSSTSASMGDFQ